MLKRKLYDYLLEWKRCHGEKRLLIDGNLGTDGKKVTLPLYMAMFLFDASDAR